MKIFISTSAKAKAVSFEHLAPTEENKETIARLRKLLSDSKVKGKLSVSKVKGTTSIVLEKVPTALQYKSFLDSIARVKLNIRLLPKSNPISKQAYYEVQIPSEIKAEVKSEKELAVLKIRTASSKLSPLSKDLHNQLNAKSKPLAKVFGYWRMEPLKEMSKLPFPVAVEVAGYDKTKFMAALKTFMSECDVVANKGFSPNRWNGSKNGTREYFHPSGWRMPEGAVYYLSRGVPPTQEFYKAVTGKTNSKLPSTKNYSI